MKPVLRRLFTSRQFRQPENHHSRYSWPVEFVARALKEVGWTGFSANDALTPLSNMGQQLFEPGCRMIGDASEDIGEPSLRIDIVELGGLDQGVDDGGALTAAI